MKLNFVSYLSRDKGYKSFIVHIVFHEGLRPIDLYASPGGSGTPVISTGSMTGVRNLIISFYKALLIKGLF